MRRVRPEECTEHHHGTHDWARGVLAGFVLLSSSMGAPKALAGLSATDLRVHAPQNEGSCPLASHSSVDGLRGGLNLSYAIAGASAVPGAPVDLRFLYSSSGDDAESGVVPLTIDGPIEDARTVTDPPTPSDLWPTEVTGAAVSFENGPDYTSVVRAVGRNAVDELGCPDPEDDFPIPTDDLVTGSQTAQVPYDAAGGCIENTGGFTWHGEGSGRLVRQFSVNMGTSYGPAVPQGGWSTDGSACTPTVSFNADEGVHFVRPSVTLYVPAIMGRKDFG